VTPNSSGTFGYYVAWPGGTQVTAQATDAEALSSSQSTLTIANPSDANPFLTFSVSYGALKQITLSGKLIDESPANRTVTFSGSASGTATTDANGNFSVTLTANSLGSVSASATDAANHSSNTAMVTLASSAPVISNFHVSEEPEGWYEFTGDVTDESPFGLTVHFGGAPVSLVGKTCTVDLAGEFCLRIQLNGLDSDNGTASAWLSDWWGQMSNTAQDIVYQTGT
jgi:hypothetical protein